jgi:hypothetical protein
VPPHVLVGAWHLRDGAHDGEHRAARQVREHQQRQDHADDEAGQHVERDDAEAVLAAMIIHAVSKLMKVAEMRRYYHLVRREFWLGMITLVAASRPGWRRRCPRG